MNHLNEEQLVLYYYGEETEGRKSTGELSQGVEQHLGACEECRAAYHTLQRVLNSVDSFPVPERSEDYETRVWKSIEAHIGKKRTFRSWFSWRPMAIVTAVAAMLVVSFYAGRTVRKPGQGAGESADAGQVRERVLLVAVGDHLERSQMILVELANASMASGGGKLDISYETRTAEDLLEANRLYRQTASSAGDVGTAALLEDLERVLIEIAHSPTAVSTKQLEDLRAQIEDRGILFKVKVFGSQLEQRESAPVKGQGTL
jgi:hypothetical protein